jgi:gamma-glutamyltranspeptidase/glutathione hydrolase
VFLSRHGTIIKAGVISQDAWCRASKDAAAIGLDRRRQRHRRDGAVSTRNRRALMSGFGGGGCAMFRDGQSGAALCLDFGMVAPETNPLDYPLAKQGRDGLFAWPSVLEERNIKGPHSICVPGLLAGLALAHRTYGSMPWGAVVAPVIELAEAGLPIDWYSSLAILIEARDLAEFPVAQRLFLRDGLPPLPAQDGSTQRLRSPELFETLKALAEPDGPASFYHGALAQKLVEDLGAAGSRIDMTDLENYQAQFVRPMEISYRDAKIHAPGGLTAGPTLAQVLGIWRSAFSSTSKETPAGRVYRAIDQALGVAYRDRLNKMGAGDAQAVPAGVPANDAATDEKPRARKRGPRNPPASECTSHFCVVDKRGNMVSWTQTLLSRFGSKVMSPATGILMNNGIMWFDPVAHRPNSIMPAPPLTNMCPVIALPRPALALGASGLQDHAECRPDPVLVIDSR